MMEIIMEIQAISESSSVHSFPIKIVPNETASLVDSSYYVVFGILWKGFGDK